MIARCTTVTKWIGPSLFLAALTLCTAGMFLAPAVADLEDEAPVPAEVVPLADQSVELHMEDGLVISASNSLSECALEVTLTVANESDGDLELVAELFYMVSVFRPFARMRPLPETVGSTDVRLLVPAGGTVTRTYVHPSAFREEPEPVDGEDGELTTAFAAMMGTAQTATTRIDLGARECEFCGSSVVRDICNECGGNESKTSYQLCGYHGSLPEPEGTPEATAPEEE